MVEFYKKFQYLINLFSVGLLILLTVFSLNYIVNPYNYSLNYKIWDKGYYTSPILFEKANTNNLMYKYLQDIRNTESENILIGSSRVLYGFNTCNQETTLKLAKSGITFEETRVLVKEALKKENIKTIFIEIGLKNPIITNSFDIKNSSILKTSLSLSTTIISIRTLVDYFLSDLIHKSPNCYYKISSKYSTVTESKYKARYKENIPKATSVALLKFISNITKECTISNRKNLTFFVAPIHKDLISSPSQLFETKELKNKINNLEHNCTKVNFISYSESIDINSRLYNKKFWHDINHFNSEVGNIFLKTLLTPL